MGVRLSIAENGTLSGTPSSDYAAAELQGAPVYDSTTADLTLQGIGLSGNSLQWPSAAGMSYNLLSKTNLTDTTWSTNQTGLTPSPHLIPQAKPHEYYKVELIKYVDVFSSEWKVVKFSASISNVF